MTRNKNREALRGRSPRLKRSEEIRQVSALRGAEDLQEIGPAHLRASEQQITSAAFGLKPAARIATQITYKGD